MCIHARNGRFDGTCCILGMDMCLFSDDARVARIAYNNSSTQSRRFGASQIDSWHKPSQRIFEFDSLAQFLYTAVTSEPPLLGLRYNTMAAKKSLRHAALSTMAAKESLRHAALSGNESPLLDHTPWHTRDLGAIKARFEASKPFRRPF